MTTATKTHPTPKQQRIKQEKIKLLIILPTRSRGGVEEHGLAIGSNALQTADSVDNSSSWSVEVALPSLPATQELIAAFKASGASYRPLSIGETEVEAATTLSELIRTAPLRLWAWIEKPFHFLQVLFYLVRWRRYSQNASAHVVLINLPWADKGFTSLLACALLNQPTAVVFHLVPWQLEIPRWKRQLYGWMRDRRQTWIAISENNRQLVSKSFDCPAEKIIRIYNGTAALRPTEKVDSPTVRQTLRRSLGLPENSILLLTVARLSSQKGHDTLIPTISHLVRQFPNIHFVWVGDGEQAQLLARQLDRYDVRSAVSFLGYQKNISHLLAAADLFIFPTHFEGFPFALLEAMAHGIPVVATGVNGIPEIIEHQKQGLLVRKGDSCDLLETLRWALTHPDEMKVMSDRAAVKVRDFSAQKMADETLRLLAKISK